MFEVGEKYKTKGGTDVEIVAEGMVGGFCRIVLGSDGMWRYDREGDRGRVTGSALDMSDPDNLVPNA